MHKRHAQIALRGQSKALEWLEQLTPEQLRHGIGVRLLAEATKLERLARGANTEELGMTADVTVGPSRTLGELFQVPQGMTELELARVVVERATRPEGPSARTVTAWSTMGWWPPTPRMTRTTPTQRRHGRPLRRSPTYRSPSGSPSPTRSRRSTRWPPRSRPT